MPDRRPLSTVVRAATAGLLVALVLVVAALVHLPALHRALHGDNDAGTTHRTLPHGGGADADDTCAIALFAQGLESPWLNILAPLPHLAPVAALQLLSSSAPRLAPAFRLPPSQAPPTAASV